MHSSRVVFLSGGTGTPKLLQGAVEVIDADDIAVIGNTGDDWDFYGLHVSPDIDSILFTLANLIDTKKWWGIKDDTFKLIFFLKERLKEEIWFNLGDFDAGLCLLRTHLLRKGKSLTEAIEIIRKRLDIQSSVLPMADQTIQTKVRISNKTIHLQEFWVKYKGKLDVKNVFFEGDLRKTTNQVLDAIKQASTIIIGPSNPVSSIGPILAIQPLREALQNASGYRVAISPIIGTNPVSGPTSSFLRAWGYNISPVVIAELFHDVLDVLMIHDTDKQYLNDIKKKDLTPLLEDIYIHSKSDAVRLFKRIMDRK
ncbi:MAG: 2-phospho-L-lactate transferase [Promethearchaeota archaeon]